MAAVKAGTVRPYRVETPVTIEVDFKVTASANATQYIPGVSRLGPRSIAVRSDDLVQAIETFQIAARYGMQTSESRG
jgi:D-aminopeptidase